MPKIIINLSGKTITTETSAEDLQKILIANRQITDDQSFLNPKHPDQLSYLDFNLKKNVFTRFIKRLKKAINNQERILIYGDYDVDGITSTAILWQSLKSLGANVVPFLPDREVDGYGLKFKSVQRFVEEKNFKPDLILTIDNGISAKKEIRKLRLNGYKILIADHHTKGPSTPKLKYILHTTTTSAAGIAWLIAHYLKTSPDITVSALGIIADCVPLVGPNRSIAFWAIKNFSKTNNLGIKMLAKVAQITLSNLTTYEIAFGLAPRLNASGRLSNPTDSLRLLCVENSILAENLAQKINSLNQQRQDLQQKFIDEANDQINIQDFLLWSQSSNFHPGIIGLISGKLTEKHYLPSITVSISGDLAKGSCRSIPELNIMDILEECRSLFIDMGGHPMAAGFTVKTENLSKLKVRLIKKAKKILHNLNLQPKIIVDAKILSPAVSNLKIKKIQELEPFGISNPEPLFLFENEKIVSVRIMGKNNEHLKFQIGGLTAILFRAQKSHFILKSGEIISFVGKLSLNEWNGKFTPQVLIKEMIS